MINNRRRYNAIWARIKRSMADKRQQQLLAERVHQISIDELLLANLSLDSAAGERVMRSNCDDDVTQQKYI